MNINIVYIHYLYIINIIEPGDYVKPLDVVVVLETDKISVDITAEQHGIIQECMHKAGDTVNVGDALFTYKICEPQKEAPKPAAPPAKSESKSAPTTTTTPKASTPAPAPAPSTSKPASSTAANLIAPVSFNGPITIIGPPQAGRPEKRVKMSRLRQRVAQRLKDSQNTCAMLTTFQEVDMGPLMSMRKKYKDEFLERTGSKLGFMSAYVKACCMALKEIPAINSVIEGDELVYHDYVDMSVAVATPTGLMVPVIRNADQLSFAQIEGAIGELAQKARKGKIAIEDMAGGTFTISNGGVYGSLFGTPIINPPQSAILGMHGTKMRAVVDEKGNVVAKPMMYLALTYDHRIVDGAEAVSFLVSLRNKIEDPHRMLLGL